MATRLLPLMVLTALAFVGVVDAACPNGGCTKKPEAWRSANKIEFTVTKSGGAGFEFASEPATTGRSAQLKLTVFQEVHGSAGAYWKSIGDVGTYAGKVAKNGRLKLAPGKYGIVISGYNVKYDVKVKAKPEPTSDNAEPAEVVLGSKAGSL